MATQYFGERIKRNEDPRLLTGQALFVDDVHLPRMLHAAFLRSPYAHANITRVDVSKAREREGVVAVYTAADIGEYWCNGPLLGNNTPILHRCRSSMVVIQPSLDNYVGTFTCLLVVPFALDYVRL